VVFELLEEDKISPGTRAGYVADKLRQAILQGELRPGDRLDQARIAALLQVSRSPVREALRSLASENLIRVVPHRGAVVAELTQEEIEDIFYIRIVLEGRAARLASAKFDSSKIAQVSDIHAKLLGTDDLDEWLELNRSFHHTIYAAAKRPRLFSLIENLRNTTAPYVRQYIRDPKNRLLANEQHSRILQACVAHDAPGAESHTEHHLHVVVEGLGEWMGSQDRSASVRQDDETECSEECVASS
jgi:DNA-binding GntR family transcriptional regulator